MTDFQKAREAAARGMDYAVRFYPDGTIRNGEEALDAALSAFEREGFVLVPREPSKSVRGAAEKVLAGMSIAEPPTNGCGNCLINGWNAMIAAALKDRT